MLIGERPPPTRIVSAPDFGLLGEVSFGFVAKLGLLGAALAVFSLMLSDFFDTVGTALGLGAQAGFVDEQRPPAAHEARADGRLARRDGRRPGLDLVGHHVHRVGRPASPTARAPGWPRS